MCDALFQKFSVRNVASVGHDNDAAIIASLQHTEPIPAGFRANSVKMSKDGSLTVLGSSAADSTDGKRTQRPGVHIYLKKTIKTNGRAIVDDWNFHQTIATNSDNETLQVDSLSVSNDGSSIVALDRGLISQEPKLYCIGRSDLCNVTPRANWSIQETLSRVEGDDTEWENMTLNDAHTRMVLRKVDGSGQPLFCVYCRQRVLSRRQNAQQSADAYKFQLKQTVAVASDDGNATGRFALSHDGNTLALIVDVSGDFFVFQYEFNCDTEQFEHVSEFAISNAGEPQDISFGGRHSERLFVLTVETSGNEALVDVHQRQPLNGSNNTSLCIDKNKLCGADRPYGFFSDETRLVTIENASVGGGIDYSYHLLADPVDGDFFVVVSTQQTVAYNEPKNMPLFVSMWRGCPTDAESWFNCDVSNLEHLYNARCYHVDEFDTISFNRACQRYCMTFGQIIPSVSFDGEGGTLADSVYVSNPNGCFAMNASVGNDVGLFYRVVGDRQWTLLSDQEGNEEEDRGQQIVLSATSCASKNIEVALVEKQQVWVPGQGYVFTALDPSHKPQFVLQSAILPMRLCFSVVCFHKDANIKLCKKLALPSCDEIVRRPAFGASAPRLCGKGKTCASTLPTRLWAASYTGLADQTKLYELMPQTGSACQLRQLSDFRSVTLATHPKTGIVFGLAKRNGDNVLFRIDPNSGLIVEIGLVNLPNIDSILYDISFRPGDEALVLANDAPLYLVSAGTDGLVLSVINVASAHAQQLGTIGADNMSGNGMAFDAQNRLYIVRTPANPSLTPLLVELNPLDGAMLSETPIKFAQFAALSSIEPSRPAITALAYDRCADSMYALVDDSRPTNGIVAPQYLALLNRSLTTLCNIGVTGSGMTALTTEARTSGSCSTLL